jgi:hypothetical protein
MKHVTVTETDDITAAMQDARRNIAIAKLSQFEEESLRLGAMAIRNPHRKQELVDCLHGIATANGLLRIHGGSLVEGLILAGLAGTQ